LSKINAKRYQSFYTLLNRRTLPEGRLWACHPSGHYKTHITEKDLPEDFAKLNVYGENVFLSTNGVKEILYKPNYIFNHFLKDDLLYISYNSPIEEIDEIPFFKGYDELIYGNNILYFIEAMQKNGYDVSVLQKAIEEKREWANNGYVLDFEKHKKSLHIVF